MDADRIRALIAELQALLGDAPAKPVGPDEVYLPVTGKVYPRPRPDLGEMFIGYVQRVGAATGRSTSSVASLFQGTGHLGDVTDAANWPEMADKFFNARSYMTAAQRAQHDAATAQWAQWAQGVRDR